MADYNTYETYQGDGTTKDFAIPFDYVERDDVIVERTAGDSGYVYITDNLIRLDTALAVGQALVIRRLTDVGEPVTEWRNGAAQTAEMLNSSFEQVLYATQESIDIAERALYLSPFGTYDAKGKRIINLGAAVNATDATTKGYADAILTSAKTYATNADTAVKAYVDAQLAAFEPPASDGIDERLGTQADRVRIRTAAPQFNTTNAIPTGALDISGTNADITGFRFLGYDRPYQIAVVTANMDTSLGTDNWYNGALSLAVRRRYVNEDYTRGLASFTLSADPTTGKALGAFASSDFATNSTTEPMKVAIDTYNIITEYGGDFQNLPTFAGVPLVTTLMPEFEYGATVDGNLVVHAGNLVDFGIITDSNIDDYLTGWEFGAQIAMNSGSGVNLTGIPSDVNEIIVFLKALSGTATAHIQVQVIEGTLKTSGYFSSTTTLTNAAAVSVVTPTDAFAVSPNQLATSFYSGYVRLMRSPGTVAWHLITAGRTGSHIEGYCVLDSSSVGDISGIRVSVASGTFDGVDGNVRIGWRK